MPTLSPIALPLGPVMVDIAGTTLTAAERARLCHPLTGGIILFSRNFESVAQLCALTAEIRALRSPALLIAVDHEGGRVQRFRTGFTRLPAMAELGLVWNDNPALATQQAQQIGWLLAAELRASGVDFSFTPVLDLDYAHSGVIGNRAFHQQAPIISALSGALIEGLRRAGMAGCGKHFPGHGFVAADSHHEIPVDERDFAAIMRDDVLPYVDLIPKGLESIMPAHVIYPQCDPLPAGFSPYWLQTILRQQLQFDGVIFSDDLWMQGASVAGATITERANAALQAGCDMVLVCNQPTLADELLQNLTWESHPDSIARLLRMQAQGEAFSWASLAQHPDYAAAIQTAIALGADNPTRAYTGANVGENTPTTAHN